MATIGIGTGRLLRKSETKIEEWLSFFEEIGIDGIEVGLESREAVEEFDPETLDGQTGGFEFVTVYGPFRDYYDEDDVDLIEDVEAIRRRLDADRVVYHPDTIASLDLVADRSPVAIENMQARKDFGREKFDQMMDGVETPIVIDTAHAATWDNDETRRLYETYGGRISHFHVSALGEDEHDPFFEYLEFLDDDLVEMLAGHRLVVESRVSSKNELRREVELLDSALN
jgi:sugar phosphate isomerase/epimerase